MHQSDGEGEVGVSVGGLRKPARGTGGVQAVPPELGKVEAGHGLECTGHAAADDQVADHHEAQHADGVVDRCHLA